MIYDSKNSNITIDVAKRYFESFNLNIQKTENDESLQSIRNTQFDILLITKYDTVSYEEDIQEILDTGKSVIIANEEYFEDEYNWFVGKIGNIYPPLLPNDLYHTILEFISPAEKKTNKTSYDSEKGKGKQILIVDDNAINLKFMKEILKVIQAEAILAHSAKEGLEKFENQHIDMIFMDENMPGMQGEEAIVIIREAEKMNNLNPTVIIGLTGDSDKKTKERMVSAGANKVLTKPIQFKEIMSVIAKYL